MSVNWTEQFVSSFAKEFVKHDVLIEAYKTGCKHTKVEKLRRGVALYCLARDLGLMLEEGEMMKMCMKLRFALLSRLRRLARRCAARGWPEERALLLAPKWLRLVESHLHLLPQAIKLESQRKFRPKSKVSAFKEKMVETATEAVQAGKSIFSPEVIRTISNVYGVEDGAVEDLWKRTCNHMQEHIIAMAEAGDSPPRIFITDWRVADLVLLYDGSFRIVNEACLTHTEQLQGLLELYKIIVKKNVENLLRNKSPDLVQAWISVYATYSYSATNISLILLQRRWYELKLEARSQVLSYWRGERDAAVPHPLLLSIVSKYVILEPFPAWADLVNSGQVVKLEDVSKELYQKALQEAQKDWGDEVTPCICVDDCDSSELTNKEKDALSSKFTTFSSDDESELVIDESSPMKSSRMDMECRESKKINQNTIPKIIDAMKTLFANKLEDAQNENNRTKSESEIPKQIHTKDILPKMVESQIDVDSNINILNTFDPTKAQISLIFDSDSEPDENISNNALNNITSDISNNKNEIFSGNNNSKSNDMPQKRKAETNVTCSVEKDLEEFDKERLNLTETATGSNLEIKSVNTLSSKNDETDIGKTAHEEIVKSKMDVSNEPDEESDKSKTNADCVSNEDSVKTEMDVGNEPDQESVKSKPNADCAPNEESVKSEMDVGNEPDQESVKSKMDVSKEPDEESDKSKPNADCAPNEESVKSEMDVGNEPDQESVKSKMDVSNEPDEESDKLKTNADCAPNEESVKSEMDVGNEPDEESDKSKPNAECAPNEESVKSEMDVGNEPDQESVKSKMDVSKEPDEESDKSKPNADCAPNEESVKSEMDVANQSDQESHKSKMDVSNEPDEESNKSEMDAGNELEAEIVKSNMQVGNDPDEENDEFEMDVDPKLIMYAAVPLVKCDLTRSWKKHFKNNYISIRNVHKENFLPLKHSRLKPKSTNTPVPEKSRAKRVYSPQALIANPDFDINLKSLSKSFFRIKKNRRLLNMCKPLTVDLERSPLITAIKKESPVNPKLMRIAKKIELPNIDEVRKINRMILTAQVAPVTMGGPLRIMVLDASKSAESSGRLSSITSVPGSTAIAVNPESEENPTITKMSGIDSCSTHNEPSPSHRELKTLLKTLWTRANETPAVTDSDATSGVKRNRNACRACRCGGVPVTTDQGDKITPDVQEKYHERFLLEDRSLSKDILTIINRSIRDSRKTSQFEGSGAEEGQISQEKTGSKLFGLNPVKSVIENKTADSKDNAKDNENIISVSKNHNDLAKSKITGDKITDNKKTNTAEKNLSDSDDDNIKLSIVVDTLKKDRKQRKRKRKIKKPRQQRNNQFLTSQKRQKELNEQPSGTCLDEYQEWLRQKNLALKYFNIPNVGKSSNKNGPSKAKKAKSSDKYSENSGREITPNTTEAATPESFNGRIVLYRNNDNGHKNISAYTGYHLSHRSILKRILYDSHAAVQHKDTLSQHNQTVIDLTDTPDGQNIEETDAPGGQSSNLVIQQNASYTLSSGGTLLTENKTPSENTFNVFGNNDASTPSNSGISQDDSFTPIITSVCSLANTKFDGDFENNLDAIARRSNVSQESSANMPKQNTSVHLPLLFSSIQSATSAEPTMLASVLQASINPVPLGVNSVKSPAQPTNALQYNTLNPILVPASGQPARIATPLQAFPRQSDMASVPSTSLQAMPTPSDSNPVPFVHIGTLKTNSVTLNAEQHPTSASGPSTSLNTEDVTGNIESTVSGRQMISNGCPCMSAALWAHRRPQHALRILRLDAARTPWTLKCGQLVLTEYDMPCERPTYWSLGPSKSRDSFPLRKDGSVVFNPVPVKADEKKMDESTPFARWVESVTLPKENDLADNQSTDSKVSDANDVKAAKEDLTDSKFQSNTVGNENVAQVNETVENANAEMDARPTLRLKVKSFARLDDDEIFGMTVPDCVTVQEKLYQKVCDQPLSYAKVLTAVPNLQAAQRLMAVNAPLYVLSQSTGRLLPLHAESD